MSAGVIVELRSGQSRSLYVLGAPPINYSPRTKQGGTNAVHDAMFGVT